jgi:penicillin-binding protein 2
MFNRRIRTVSAVIFISFLVLVSALFYLQILRFAHYRSLSLKNSVRVIPVQASRGGIYDRKGKILAKDEISFDLVIIPQEVSNVGLTLKRLSRITGIKEKELKSSYNRNYRLPFVPAKVAENLKAEDAFRIEERLSHVAGALIRSVPRRIYPNNDIASHIIGYIGKIAPPELKRLKAYGYSIRDLVGKSGVEKYYDVYLQGEDGGIQIVVDSFSREVSRLGFKEPRGGRDIILTIDLGLQRFMDMLFKNKNGAFIVMETKTGRVLGLVSHPEFNPNVFAFGSNRERVKILTDKRYPLLNRAITCSYPPGSAFKVVVSCAGIATGTLKRATSFMCKGIFFLGKRGFRCWKKAGHGYQNVVDALTHSCNVFFYNVGQILGAEELHRYALAFGLGTTTGIDLPSEIKGVAPGPLWKRFVLKKPWYEGDTINYSIGQGYLLATPIQMLRVITIVANDGYCPQPYIVEKIEGRRVSKKKDFITRLKPGTFKLVKEGLFGAVNSSTGTGQHAKVKGLNISGKTGTAQPGTKGNTHAWFIGYLPSNEPKISFVIFVEHGGKGGAEAAKMARLTAIYLKENGFLK